MACAFRAAHLLFAGSVVVAGPFDARAAGLYAVLCAVSAVVYGPALVRGRLRPAPMWADVLLTGCLLPGAGVAVLGEGPAVTPHGWLMVPALSAAAAAVVVLGRRGTAVAVVLLLATSGALYRAVPGSDPEELLAHGAALLQCVAMAAAAWWYLHRQGVSLDAAQERAVVAEAARARQAERAAHHAALHDTVLATLSTIAAGRVDANAQAVRDRCAREAAYLRRLVQLDEGTHRRSATAPAGVTGAGTALEEVVRSAEGLGLTVRTQYHAVPDVPADVAEALAAAVREALNNVRRHAGTSAAYCTVMGRAGGVAVTVADRGVGFDPSDAAALLTAGTGLRRSVHGRMAAVGGTAEVDSRRGEGTVVELRWPA
ncbi:sensor histidine kinase [Streptomyces sp. NPDC012888]|uniref:sensor histidine kinase n=1 Tax=Streptomyces sp. NPDC012888 TaxID=3364855 RepID=UPI003689695B